MKVNPYLTFNGQCQAAFKFYEEVLHGKVVFSMTWGEMPGAAEQFPAEMHKLIMHTSLSVGEQTIMGADAPPDRYQQPQGINVSLHLQRLSRERRPDDALSKDFLVARLWDVQRPIRHSVDG
jgi:PhnB protein